MTPRLRAIPAEAFRRFVMIVRRLRRDCPWDRRQTHRSLRHSLIEEAYEVVHAIEDDDPEELKSELGDLLLHVVMHATIAEQKGEFTLGDILEGISQKLVRRHPHVFGTARAGTADEVKQSWERLKMQEGRASRLQGIPSTLPALQRAIRMQQRAAKVGFDWSETPAVWAKVREELKELEETFEHGSPREREEEFGDFLFALVNLARFLKIHPEDALRQTNRKFERRFRFIERALQARGSSPEEATLEEMDALWEMAKKERSAGKRRST
jgi:tetrapyrrole methylase family protein/MazG family protein